jgi:ABC-type branched-subunit amino acid transport system substrate-binding protein
VLLAVTCAAAAACDAADASQVSSVDDPPCNSPGVTADQVKLGLLYPFSGNASTLFRPFRAGIDARLGVANDAGGVHGREIVYTWRDDESREAGNLAAARSLVDSDQVFGIVESTSVATGSAEFLHERGVPVTGASLEAPWTVYDNMFSYSNMIADGPSISTWGEFAAERGGHRAIVVESTFSSASMEMAKQLADSLRAAGIEVVDSVDVTTVPTSADIVDIGNRIADTGADVVVGAVTGLAFAQVVAGARGAGADLKVVMSPTGYDQSILGLFHEVLAGVYFFVDYVPFESATQSHHAFAAAMTSYAPYVQPPNQQVALSGWISADMFLRGLQEAGPCPTRERFVAGLRAVHSYDAAGLLPEPVDLTADFGKLNLCYTFVQVRPDGAGFEVVEPAPRCGTRLD